eukprot:TRINITY_DN3105_c0_g3_i1.p4 TRINITY_DN3105_c0_g3~~TRINITY_DN3105_c0_g3_i1.p4  ORF type:complete len:158 (-),score=45.68 TRINITY_DN3105_c0_g3_i1:278-751(-)
MPLSSAPARPASVTPPDLASRRIFVGNLSWRTTWQMLKDHFRKAGDVVRAEVMLEPDGRSRGCGVVEFREPASVANALQTLQQTELDGRTVHFRADRDAAKSATAASASAFHPPVVLPQEAATSQEFDAALLQQQQQQQADYQQHQQQQDLGLYQPE